MFFCVLSNLNIVLLLHCSQFLKSAIEELKMTAGNFYVNDKSTGSVVGQQPFGGARLSGIKYIISIESKIITTNILPGTNDKAGGPHYVLRWGNPQAIKETFVPLTEVNYPYMSQ